MARTKAPAFSDFWQAYPLHMGKREAKRAWDRLSARDKQKALAGIPAYREYVQQTGVFVMYPQGWLNGRRWEDEYEDSIASFANRFEQAAHKEDGTKTEQSCAAAPLPPRGGAGVGSVATPNADALSDMDTW